MAGPLGRLHLVTDVRRDRDPVGVVRAALSAGVPVVQVRVPDHVSDLGAYHLSMIIADLCREAGATCLINDRLHIALAVGAAGASYLGVGPAFATSTKNGLPDPIGAAGVRKVAEAVPIPVIAIGAVTASRVPELLAAGAYGVAVVTAVSDAPDPAAAVAELLAALPVEEPA